VIDLSVNETRTPPKVVVGFITLSVVASLFLGWLVYFHAPADLGDTHLAYLPMLNALFNGLAAGALVMGYRCIRAKLVAAHRAFMFAAFVFSSLFLACYIANYALHGESHFLGHGIVRSIYFPLLISHIVLAVVCLPMILITFFLSLTGRFPIHKKLARWTFPIWLYVAVTGVIVYLMLAAYR
jgi:putative membrane protein